MAWNGEQLEVASSAANEDGNKVAHTNTLYILPITKVRRVEHPSIDMGTLDMSRR